MTAREREREREKKKEEEDREAISQRGQEHAHQESTEEVEDVKPNCGKEEEERPQDYRQEEKVKDKGEELEDKEAIPKRGNRRRTSTRLTTHTEKPALNGRRARSRSKERGRGRRRRKGKPGKKEEERNEQRDRRAREREGRNEAHEERYANALPLWYL